MQVIQTLLLLLLQDWHYLHHMGESTNDRVTLHILNFIQQKLKMMAWLSEDGKKPVILPGILVEELWLPGICDDHIKHVVPLGTHKVIHASVPTKNTNFTHVHWTQLGSPGKSGQSSKTGQKMS